MDRSSEPHPNVGKRPEMRMLDRNPDVWGYAFLRQRLCDELSQRRAGVGLLLIDKRYERERIRNLELEG